VLERLAQLESRLCRVFASSWQKSAEVVAAQPLDGGPALADPFHATEHLLPLLRLRADQLASGRRVLRRWPLGRRWTLARVSGSPRS
jgi:hypothetical protein